MTMRAVFCGSFFKFEYWNIYIGQCGFAILDGENIKRFYMNKNSNDTKMKDENLVWVYF